MRWIFGAHGQVALGLVLCVGSVGVWIYGATLHGAALITLLFHVSMAALVFAAYSIIATGLGYRATERVETAVVENAEQVTVESDEDPGTDGRPPSRQPA